MSDIRLTNREYAVLRGLASGLTQLQIAARLDRSVETIQRDMRNLQIKLGATTRPQIVDRGWRLSLINADTPPLPHEQPLPASVIYPEELIRRRRSILLGRDEPRRNAA